MQQLGACELRTDRQAAARAFQPVDFILGNGDDFVHIQARIQNYHRRHQLGNRGNRHNAVHVLLIQHFAGTVIDNQGCLRRQQRAGNRRLRFQHIVRIFGQESTQRVLVGCQVLLQKLAEHVQIVGQNGGGSQTQTEEDGGGFFVKRCRKHQDVR